MIITKFLQSLKMAISSILSNKIRMFLTMLGMIIGVASVVLLIGLSDGSQKEINDSLSSMGTDLITVQIRNRSASRVVSPSDIMEFYNDNRDILVNISPYIGGSTTAKVGTTNESTTLECVDASFADIRGLDLDYGRFITEDEVKNRQNVAVVGTYIQQEFFDGQNPIGQQIKLNGIVYEIVGVLEETGDSTKTSADNKVIIPYTTARKILSASTPSTYYIQAASDEAVDVAVNTLKNYFNSMLGKNQATVTSQKQIMEVIDEVMGMLSALLGGIAGISLVVAGIGIMNIMLVSVTERTREIGIRKAIGARRGDILLQFLIESVIISCMGGLIGLLLAIGIGNAAAKLVEALNFVATQASITLAFSFAVIVGVFFGLYPAQKASKLNPIEALRFE